MARIEPSVGSMATDHKLIYLRWLQSKRSAWARVGRTACGSHIIGQFTPEANDMVSGDAAAYLVDAVHEVTEIDSKCCICKQTVGPCETVRMDQWFCVVVKAVSMVISTRFAQERHPNRFMASQRTGAREARAHNCAMDEAKAIWLGCDVVCLFRFHSAFNVANTNKRNDSEPKSRPAENK